MASAGHGTYNDGVNHVVGSSMATSPSRTGSLVPCSSVGHGFGTDTGFSLEKAARRFTGPDDLANRARRPRPDR